MPRLDLCVQTRLREVAGMNTGFVLFSVLWALLVIVVLALIAYRKLVSLQEEETLPR